MPNAFGGLVSRLVFLFFWAFVFYVFIFQPPVIPKLYYLAAQFAIFIVFILFFGDRFLRVASKFKSELLVTFLIVCYSCARDMITGEVVYFDRFAGWFFQAFLIGIMLLILFDNSIRDSRYKYHALDVVYISVAIASILTLALYFFPSFDFFYEKIQLDAYYDLYSQFDKRYRAYGISENLTFTYAFVLGLMAGYSLILSRRSILYLLFVPVFLFGVSVNARVGFLGFLIVFLYLVFLGRGKDKIYIAILSIFSLILIYYLGSGFFYDYSWRFGFFVSVYEFLSGDGSKDNTINYLLNNHLVFPDLTVNWLFGTGRSLFGLSSGEQSDIGYILQLNYGGLVLLIFLSFLVFYMSARLVSKLGMRHWYSFAFPASIIFLNFKGFIFAMTPGGRLLIFLYVFYVAFNSNVFSLKRCPEINKKSEVVQ